MLLLWYVQRCIAIPESGYSEDAVSLRLALGNVNSLNLVKMPRILTQDCRMICAQVENARSSLEQGKATCKSSALVSLTILGIQRACFDVVRAAGLFTEIAAPIYCGIGGSIHCSVSPVVLSTASGCPTMKRYSIVLRVRVGDAMKSQLV